VSVFVFVCVYMCVRNRDPLTVLCTFPDLTVLCTFLDLTVLCTFLDRCSAPYMSHVM
jgi:hypothetical protein